MSREVLTKLCKRGKPYLLVIFLQFGYAGLGIIAKFGLNHGMNHYTFTVYRNVAATIFFAPFALLFERKVRPRMTISIFVKILLLSLLEPVLDQNLYFTGMKYTTVTFSAAMSNMVPAATFLMAWILRLEKVNVRRLSSQAKVVGTLVTVGGAMVMTLTKGRHIGLPWIKTANGHDQATSPPPATQQEYSIKGSLMITSGCFCWAAFYILQSITLSSYPAGLSLTTLICLMGSLEGAALAFIVEKGNMEIWSLSWDTKLLSALYGGIICSGVGYYVSGVVMKEKGPVFVTAYNPLTMVIVAVMGSFILGEQIYVGMVAGAILIVTGLYLVIWSKSKDDYSSKPFIDEAAPIDRRVNKDSNVEIETSTREVVKCTKVMPKDEAV